MPSLSDILLGKLALRQELVSTAALMECMAKQHQDSQADLGDMLVKRRLISTASLTDLRTAANKAQLMCLKCSRSFRPDQLGNATGLVCQCGSELQIMLDGMPVSDRIATGPTERYKTVVLDEAPAEEEKPLPPKPPQPTRKQFGRLGKSFKGKFGAYEIVEELGRGGMGVVYKARQPRLNRFVALKILLAGPLASRTQTERFRREAEITARLRHPGIVQIHDVGKVGEHDYFTMDYVEGTPLNLLIKRRQVPIRRAVEIAREIAEALHHAHERGAVHRDVKPANLIINKAGSPVLTDFGLARDMDEDEAHRLTNSGSVVGTPYYMAPEQARGERDLISGWTDVYALGVVLYECLTYRVPFRAKTHLELTKKILGEQPQPPSQIEPAIELELEAVVLKAMAKSHDERYPTAKAMADDLANFLEGRPTSVGANAGRRVIRELRRRSAWVFGPVLGVILVLGGVWAAAAYFEEGTISPPIDTPTDPPTTTPDSDDDRAQDAALEALSAFRAARQASERSGAYLEALERAEGRTTEALSLDDQRADMWVLRGRIYVAMHRDRDAESDLKQAAEIDPGGPAAAEAGFLIAALHQRDKKPQEARIAIRAALERAERPGPWGSLLRGRQSLMDGDYDGALEQAQQAAAENPELSEASLLQGAALQLLEREKEARSAYERATRLNDKSEAAWASLGILAISLGDIPRGVEALSHALTLRPELREARWARALAYRQLGRLDEALQDLRTLEREDKDSIEILCQLAQLYMLRHRVDDAQSAADRALKLGPREPSVYITRTAILLNRYDTRAALKELHDALGNVPTEHPEWDELERYFVSLSLTSFETDELERFVSAKLESAPPEDRRKHYALIRQLLEFANDPEANLPALREACLGAPHVLRGWNLFLVYLLKLETPEAEVRAEIERMLSVASEVPALYGIAARVYFTIGDSEAGERALEKGLSLAPENPDLATTRAMLIRDPRTALSLLVEPVAAYPLRHEYQVIMAKTLLPLDTRQSELRYQAALSLVPFELEPSTELAQLLIEDKRPEACVTFLTKQQELYAALERPLPFTLSVLLSRAYLTQGNKQDALRVVQVAAATWAGTPYEVESRCLLVLTLRQTQAGDAFLREFEKLQADFPAHPAVAEVAEILKR